MRALERCARCEEPIRTDGGGGYLDEVAEVAGAVLCTICEAECAANEYCIECAQRSGASQHLLVHQGCMKEGEEIA